MLPILRTDRPIFEESRTVSVLLRMAQFKLLASGGETDEIAACVDALMREAGEEPNDEVRELLGSLALGSVLNTIGIASSVPNWVGLLQRFKASVERSPILQEYGKSAASAFKDAGITVYGMIFNIGSANLPSVKRLEELLVDLDGLSGADRAVWLEGFERDPTDYSLLVNPPWTSEERRGELSPSDAAERYKRMAALAQKWGSKALERQCHIARAVMFDEYVNDEAAAQAAIDDGVAALGEDVAFSRARARIFWRNDKHADSVKILREIADVVGRESPVERAAIRGVEENS